MPMARCIVDKERCVEHAIERGGNGSCLKVRPDFEPILDEVMVARKRKSKKQSLSICQKMGISSFTEVQVQERPLSYRQPPWI